MNIDITSFFFNSRIENGTATASWGTSIGQSKSKNCRIEDDKPGVMEILTGMLYKSISDKGHIDISAGSRNREILLCSLFDKIYINNQRITDQSFLLFLVREKSKSHDGRLLISYPPYALYDKTPINQNAIEKIRQHLGCNSSGCWFVYDISIKNQDELHFSAIVVDKDKPTVYHVTSKERSEEWAKLVGTAQHIILQNNPLQTIYFGSPGTGKSFHIKNDILSDVKEENIFRTTFHPDSDYASFVGTYKPVSKKAVRKNMDYEAICSAFKNFKDTTERPFHKFIAEHYEDIEAIGKLQFKQMFLDTGITEDTYKTEYSKAVSIAKYLNKIKKANTTISYEFEPQVFTEAYIKAWQHPEEQIYLVIEEINRGNCAQIFGDLFQLLDRKNGISEYPVKADVALAKYLIEELGDGAPEGIENGKLKLPANLNIIATMNTSDQSLFPMDSAFKRRWEWKYIPTIAPANKERKLDLNFKENKEGGDKKTIDAGDYSYSWKEFLKAINTRITKATHSDDKQLGFWFVKAENEEDNISISTFVSKVIFYLWNDIFKDFGPKDINPFTVDINGSKEIMPFSSFFEINSDGQIVENIGVLHTFMQNLKIEPEIKKEITEAHVIQEQGDNPDE